MAKRRRYSPEEIERGLTALILAGSSPKASELTGIEEVTLRAWKQKHADKYERLCKDIEPRVVDKIAAQAENLALRIGDIEAQVITSFDETTIASLTPSEKAGTLRNLATAKALQIDKLSSPLRERPSHVQHTQDLDTMVQQMARLLGFDATTTAIDVSDDTVPLIAERSASNAHTTAA